MAEYEMPIDEQVKLLVKKFGAFETKLDSVDVKLDRLDAKVGTLDEKVGTLDEKVGTLGAQVGEVQTKLDTVLIRLDDTRAIAKLGLEAVQATRESMKASFDAMTKANKADSQLLKDVIVHVRKRVEFIERPRARRRRS